MKRFRLIPMFIAFIVLISGCGAQSASTSAEPLPVDDDATEITIEVRDVSGFYQSAALKFEDQTGVKVNVINSSQSDVSSDELFENVERIQAELMAGKGADIYVNSYIDYVDIGNNKHLCNLADWIAQDPDFSDDTYFMNILTSGFDKGDVYSIPLFMMFNALGAAMEVPELEGKNLNWEEFFDLTKDIKKSGVLYGVDDYMLFSQRFKDRYDSFIDEKNKTQRLDSPEMIQLMEQCKQWSTDGLCMPITTENYSEVFNNAFFKEYGGDIELLTNIQVDDPSGVGSYFYDIPSDSGKNDKANKISPIDSICINAASPYKGTAWKFLKFLLSEDIQGTGPLTPLNRKAAAADISKYLNDLTDFYHLDIDVDQTIKESEAILDTVTGVAYVNPSDIEQIVCNKNAQRFFRNEISAEEAAKSMAAGVELYFKEQ